jgi:hypothetical protein
MSLPPNWTPDGTEPDPMHHIPLRPRPRACISADHGPDVPCVDWTPCLLDSSWPDVRPRAVGCPSPEPRANWDRPHPGARSH